MFTEGVHGVQVIVHSESTHSQKALVKHNEACLPHGWVTISCQALCTNSGVSFPGVKNSLQTLSPTNAVQVKL